MNKEIREAAERSLKEYFGDEYYEEGILELFLEFGEKWQAWARADEAANCASYGVDFPHGPEHGRAIAAEKRRKLLE